ncbi:MULTISPECIES: YncE family protein [unclassified Bacillus (in: firmicutes)]|uniref:YncE family protein n=1 Tax=unclassified Bacillus (in: firmicutes) TaxID=185979 RepID=UPI002FFD63A4
MKRIFVLLLAITLITPIFQSHSASAADPCAPYKGMKKVFWDGIELKKGQIGRLHTVKSTPLFFYNGDKKIISHNLNPKGTFRIYSFRPGTLGVGGGYYVDRDSRVRYETPSKAKLQAQACVYRTPAPPLTDYDRLKKEIVNLELAIKNNESQAQIEEKSKRIQTMLDSIKYKPNTAIKPLLDRLKTLSKGYVTLAEWEVAPKNFNFDKMLVDESRGYLYVSAYQKLYVLSTKDLSMIKEFSYDTGWGMQLYNGKVILGGYPMRAVDPVTEKSEYLEALDGTPIQAQRFIISNDHIYYAPKNGATEIHDFDMKSRTVKVISKKENPEDYIFNSNIKLSIDPIKKILYVSNSHVKAIDLSTYNILSEDNYRPGFWPSWDASNIWDNGELIIDGFKMNPTNLKDIIGKYVDGFEPVSLVKGKYAIGGSFIYDRESFVPYRSMPTSRYEEVSVDSSMNLYAYNSEEGMLRKLKLNILPIHLPAFQNGLNKQLQFEKAITDWEYDQKTNKIYALSISDNKLFYINASTMNVEKEIYIGSRPWELVVNGDSIYVSLEGSHRIAVASTDPTKPISYISVTDRPSEIEVGKNYIYYSHNNYYVSAYDRRNGQTVEAANIYRANLKLDQSRNVLYMQDDTSGGSIYAFDADTFQEKNKLNFDTYPGVFEMFVDGNYLYTGRNRINLDLSNRVKILDEVILYVGKNHIITTNGYYDKATLAKQKKFTLEIHSAAMNANNEVFILDKDQTRFIKYNSVKEIW